MKTHQKKVLIVEDDESIRKIIGIELKKEGIEVHEAINGEQGLAMLEDLHPDLLLVDVIMPRMHGMDLIHKLREAEWGRKLPVIILTNFADDPKVREIVAEAGYTLIKKASVKLQELIQIVISKLA
ncbi:MAG: response regulator [Patescibacteria group bacterium]|jgi:DNA-binding response OmpR family regulator